MPYSTRERKELRARWSPVRTTAVNSGLSKALSEGDGLGRHAQRVDLRGVAITGNVIYKTLAGLDLSCCSFEGFGQFNSCRFTDCLFLAADIRNNLKKAFERCSFQAARLSEVTIGETFGVCDFSGSRWSRVFAVGASFTECVFTNVRFDQVKLLDCTFKRCEFGGARFSRSELGSTVFVGSTINLEQFTDCFMEGARFEE